MKSILHHIKNIFSGNSAKEPDKPLPAYSPQSGLPPEFIKKYNLSSRETEITEALLLGKSNKDIAALLNIALNTVQVHLKNIYRKTNAKGRYALMALAGVVGGDKLGVRNEE
ncbi:MAG: helix-turn-helix transcriptional regulator [Treponema sp.]|jgi:DNA-binding NarL/FixJ family response regulator|nr:helix-turn-helix transcriptional regulator [Treponema sp.]